MFVGLVNSIFLLMVDFSALNEIIEKLNNEISGNNKLLITLFIFVGINIIGAVVNIIVQFKLKNKEKNINNHNLREAKRIEKQAMLYNMLEDLSYFDGSNKDFKLYHKKVSEINKFLTKERLFLSKELIRLSQEFSDYFLGVLSDYRTKSYEKEMKILDNFCIIFNNGKH